MSWMEENNSDQMHPVIALLEQVNDLQESLCQGRFDSILQHDYLTSTLNLWKQYLEYLHNDNGALSAF